MLMETKSHRTATEAVHGYRLAYGLLGAVIVLWGINWPVMKVGLTLISPLWFAVARLLMGAGTLFLVLLATGRLRLPPRQDIPVLLSVTLLQLVGFLALVNIGLLYVDAGRSAILAYTTPLWVTPGAVLLLGERLTGQKALGLVLGLGGVAVLFNPMGFDWSDPDVVKGNAILMAGAALSAGGILHVRAHRWESTPLQLALWQMLLGGVILLFLAWHAEDFSAIRWSTRLVAILAYNGPVATAFCFWATLMVMKNLPTISTSLGLLGVPVAGVVFSSVLLNEPITLTIACGLLLIMAGMALVNLPELRE